MQREKIFITFFLNFFLIFVTFPLLYFNLTEIKYKHIKYKNFFKIFALHIILLLLHIILFELAIFRKHLSFNEFLNFGLNSLFKKMKIYDLCVLTNFIKFLSL